MKLAVLTVYQYSRRLIMRLSLIDKFLTDLLQVDIINIA